jgi:putative ABC transport system permease protein
MTSKLKSFISMMWQMALMALNYLNGRKLRTALTTLSIVFGVAVIFSINILLPSAVEAFSRVMSATSGNADVTLTSVTGAAFESAPPLATVGRVEGIKAVTGVLRRLITLPSIGKQGSVGEATQIELVGLDPLTAPQVREYLMSEGRFLQPGDTGAAILPAGIADLAPQLKLGTTFPLITAGGLRLYTVVGFLAEQGNPTAPQIIVSLNDAQAALNQPGQINSIQAAVTTGSDKDAVATAAQQALGDGFHLASAGGATDSVAASMNIGYAMFNVLGLLALFLGGFLIFNTFRTVILERRRDLGMLRAIGATRRQLVQMIVIESLIQGLIGTLAGMTVGYLLAVGLTRLWMSIAASFLPGLVLQANVTLPTVIGALSLGLLTALLAGYWPARMAGRTSPLEALRPATVGEARRAARWGLIAGGAIMALAVLLLFVGERTAPGGAVLFMVGMVIAAPGLVLPLARLLSPILTVWFVREGDLARGNIIRQPGRAAITTSTLMIGLASLIMMVALVDGFRTIIYNMVSRNFSSDVILTPQTLGIYGNVIGADPALAERLRALPEVQTVTSLRYATSTVNGKALEMLGIEPAGFAQLAPLQFTNGNETEAYAALNSGRNMLLNSITAAQMRVTVGSELTLQTPTGPQVYRVVGVGDDLLSFKISAAFISHANMATDFRKAEDVMIMMSLKPGTDKAAAFKGIEAVAADYPQFTATLTGEYRAVLEETILGGMSLFYGLSLVILIPAALGLLNTLTINVMERTREIGIVRAVGGSRTQVRRIVTAEALLLGLFGIATGVLAGIAISYGFLAAFGAVGWRMPYVFPVMAIIAASVVGVLLALFVSVLPARNAAKLDIIRALQYE